MAPLAVLAWTEPTADPPGSNVPAPINIGPADQTRDGWLGLKNSFNGNALSIIGNAIMSGANRYLNFGTTWGTSGYGIRDNAGTLEFKNNGGSWDSIQNTVYNFVGGTSPWQTSGTTIYNTNTGGVGIGTAGPSGKLGVTGSGNQWSGYFSGATYGVYSSATNIAVQGQSTSNGYGGYFTGYGGVFAQNSSGYYAYLGYPGSSWGVLSNGNMYASDYYIAATGKWASQSGSSVSYVTVIGGCNGWVYAYCPAGKTTTGGACTSAYAYCHATSMGSNYYAGASWTGVNDYCGGYTQVTVACI